MTDDKIKHEETQDIPEKTSEIEVIKKKLREYEVILEDMVKERTRELEETNRKLQEQIESHKVAEKNLLDLNVEFNQICNVSIPICVIDENHSIIHVNDTFCSYFEIPEDEVYKIKCYEIRRGPWCHTDKCTLQQIAKSKKSVFYEHSFVNSKNEKKYFLIAAHPYISPEGEFLGIIENFMDITERKRAQAALEESEVKFRTIFEQSPIAKEIYNAEGELNDINPKCLELFGVESIDDVKGFKLFEDPNLPPEAKEKLRLGEMVFYESTFNFDLVKELNLYRTSRSGQCYIDVFINPLIGTDNLITGYLVQVVEVTDLKETEAALKESERKFRTIFEQSPIAKLICNAEGKLIDINTKCLELFGVTTIEDVKGFDLFEDPNIPKDVKEKVTTGEMVFYEGQYDFELIKKFNLYKTSCSGQLFINLYIKPLRAMDNIVTGYLIQVIDISKLKQTEAKLRESEYKLKERVKELSCLYKVSQLIETPNLPIAEILQGIVDLIPPAMQFPRITAAEIIYGSKIFQSSEFQPTKWYISTTEYIEEKVLIINIYYLVDKPFLREETDLLVDIGKRVGAFLTQKLNEIILGESEEKHRTIVESANDIICIHDIEGNILEINQTASTRLRYEKKALLGMNLLDLETNQQPKIILNRVNQLIQQGQHFYSTTYRRRDGKTIPVEVSSKFIELYGKKFVLSIVRDISERFELESLEKNFFTTISHEMRTPLSIIIQSIENLDKYHDQLSNEQKATLRKTISKNTNNILDLINDLLILAKSADKQLKTEWHTYNPKVLILKILNQLKTLIKDKKITINSDLEENSELYGDPEQIEHVFRIFIDNAIKYSSDNSSITIRAIDQYLGEYNQSNQDGILFQIADRGRGIKKEDIPFIFQKFYRSEDVSNISGTGLGLFIAQTIINHHKGEIYVESTYGKGTTFFIFLPRLIERPAD